jgi:hypothetical protein
MGSPLSHINVFILSPSVEIATFQLTAWLTDSTRFRLSLPGSHERSLRAGAIALEEPRRSRVRLEFAHLERDRLHFCRGVLESKVGRQCTPC